MPSYVQNLRKHIGHDLLLMPSVAAVVRRSGGKILLIRHSDTGAWVFPGGALEPGERPTEALKREIQEETGISAQATALIGVYAGPEFEVLYKNGDCTSYMMAVFGCEMQGNPSLVAGEEAADLGFFSTDSLGKLPLSVWMNVLLPDVLTWLNAHQ